MKKTKAHALHRSDECDVSLSIVEKKQSSRSWRLRSISVGLSRVVLTPVDKALSRQTEAVDAFTKLPIKAPGKAIAKITRATTFPLSYLISLERIQLPFDHSTPSSQQLQPTVLCIFTSFNSLDILTPHAQPCRTRGLAHPRPSMAPTLRLVETPVRTPNACNRASE